MNSITWLKKEADRIIRASKRTMTNGTSAFPPQVGIGYEAFWLRDYEYTLEGSIDAYSGQELTSACRLFVGSRSDGAGVDCVKFDGTRSTGRAWAKWEEFRCRWIQFTVGVAWHTYHKTKSPKLLREILDPLVKTMRSVPRDPKTGWSTLLQDRVKTTVLMVSPTP